MVQKAKKILLLNMPNTVIDDYELAKYVLDRQTVSNVPYGLLSLCSYVRKYSKNDAVMRIFDLNEEMCKAYYDKKVDTKNRVFEVLNQEIRRFRPDIVGISIMFNVSYMYLNPVVASVKNIDNNIVVIVGGNLATSLYEEILQDENIDCVCYGEGEMPLTQLVDSENVMLQIAENPAFVTRDKIKAGTEPANVMVQDLDSIPPIDFEFINLSAYKGPMTRFFQRDDSERVEDPTTLVIYTTRGCPYKCCFCACHVVHGKQVRFMSIEKVLSDVQLMIDRYRITCLMINDDNFLIHKDRAKTILRKLKALDLKVVFPSLLIRNIDEEIAGLLKEVGVSNQLVSIESGSDYVLKNLIQKPLRKDQIFTAVENMRKHGISVDTNVIIGFPGETDEHRQETLKTIYDVGFNWSHFLIVLPVPGSSLYRQCKENNYLVNYDNFYSPNLSQCNIRTPDYDPEHIQKQAYMMNLHANYVHNYNLRMENFDECILHFSNILKSVPDHAFAYYGLAKAYEGKGDFAAARSNMARFEEISRSDPFWKGYADYFGLL